MTHVIVMEFITGGSEFGAHSRDPLQGGHNRKLLAGAHIIRLTISSSKQGSTTMLIARDHTKDS